MYPLKKLSEIVKVGPQKSEVKDFIGEVSFVPMKDLKAKEKFFEVNEIKNISEVYKGYTYFKDNDILLAKVTPCFENGKSGIAKNLINGIGFGSSEFFVLRCSKDILEDYLYYKISSDNFLFEGKGNMSGAVGLQRVTKSFLENTEIPLPPLPTQKAIVQKLDTAFEKIDASIELAQKNLENIEELGKSILSETSQYEKVKIGEIVKELSAGGDLPKDKSFSKEKTEEYQIPIYANAVKEDGLYGYTHTAKIFEPAITVSARGTIGFTKLRTEPFYPIVRLLVLIPKPEKATLQYLEYIINTINLKQFGSSIPQLSVPQFKNFEIPLPPLSKQKEIVEYLDRVFAVNAELKRAYEEKIHSLKELKQSLLREAFEGRLVRE